MPVTATRMTKSASSAWLMKCLLPLIRQPPAVVCGSPWCACPHVGARAGLGHRQAVDLLAAHAGVEVLLALGLGAGEQDVGGPRHPAVVQRVVGPAELLLEEHPGHRVEAGPADLLGHVGGVETGGQGLRADLLDELGPEHARALDLLLVGVELAFDERARHLDDAALLVGQPEVHAPLPFSAILRVLPRPRPVRSGPRPPCNQRPTGPSRRRRTVAHGCRAVARRPRHHQGASW